MILPENKVLFLPIKNGKPKPYDGYRAAPEVEAYGSSIKESVKESGEDKSRKSDKDIVYGKPKIALSPLYHRQARPLPVHSNGERNTNSKYNSKEKPSKKSRVVSEKQSKREAEDEGDEEDENTKEKTGNTYQSPFKYSYDESFTIPQLEIKTYPFEKSLKDRRTREGNPEELPDDYTRGFEEYLKSLPSNLETQYGVSEQEERYSEKATQNLEANKNCKKIQRKPASRGITKRQAEEATETCYVCYDPKNSESYEQCFYQTSPASKEYFYGSSKSSGSDEPSKEVKRKHKRQAEPFTFNPVEEEIKRRSQKDDDGFSKPKESQKRKQRKNKDSYKTTHHGNPTKQTSYETSSRNTYKPFSYIDEASTKNNKQTAQEYELPKSFEYKYEEPSSGSEKQYESSKDSYEIPTHEYYNTDGDTVHEEKESKHQEYFGSSPTTTKYYDDYSYKYVTPQYSFSYSTRYPSDKSYETDEYKPSNYDSEYKFGPDYFSDDKEGEFSYRNEKRKPATEAQKERPNRGSTKFQKAERQESSSSHDDFPDPFSLPVTFPNGDVCQKKKKEGLSCLECKNEYNGATYERCQYSTKPKGKNYAYESKKSFSVSKPKFQRQTTDQNPEKSNVTEKKVVITKKSKVFGGYKPEENVDEFVQNPSSRQSTEKGEKLSNQYPEKTRKVKTEKAVVEEDSDKSASEDEHAFKHYDNYFRELFPEFSKAGEPSTQSSSPKKSKLKVEHSFNPYSNIREFEEEHGVRHSRAEPNDEKEEGFRPEELRLKDQKSRLPPNYFENIHEEGKDNLEKVLHDFQTKDWSNCKKVIKGHLTCYQCVDPFGVKNEECMYVQESKPSSKHVSYHEEKEFQPYIEEPSTIKNSQKIEESKRFRKNEKEKIATEEPEKDAEYLPKDVEYLGKGDFEGVTRLPPSGDEKHNKPSKQKNGEKRWRKTSNFETTTSSPSKVRKFPLKKVYDEAVPSSS